MNNTAIAKMGTVEGTTSNMVVNGVPINNKVLISVISCSNCNNILAQFQPNQTLRAKYAYVNDNLKTEIIYCPKCGCKLDYNGYQILDADISSNEETSSQ